MVAKMICYQLRNVIGSVCRNQTFFIIFTVLLSRYGQWTQKEYTLLGLLTVTVFSFSSYVAAFQNACNACKKKVPSEHDI